LAISDLIGKVFSSQFVAGVEQVTPILSLAQNRSSEIAEKGDGLEIALTQGLVSVADYPEVGTDITYSGLSPTKVTFALNKKKYIAFQVEDTDRAQLAFNLFSEGARQAGTKFANQLNADLRTTIGAATPAETLEIELANNDSTAAEREELFFLFDDLKSKLVTDGYGATPSVLLHPSTRRQLLEYIIKDKGLSIPSVTSTAFRDGRLTQILGVDTVTDWGATIDSTNSNDNADSYAMIGGRTLVYAGQISNIEQMRAEGRFATLWRGLQTYGSIIQEPRSLIKITQTVK